MRSESIESIKNLGPKSASMLRQAGFRERGDLVTAGPVVAYLAVRQTGARPSLNLLWALAAGIAGEHWTDLSPATKQALQAELAALECSGSD